MPLAVGTIIDFRIEKKPAWKKDGENWVQDFSREDMWISWYNIEL